MKDSGLIALRAELAAKKEFVASGGHGALVLAARRAILALEREIAAQAATA